ncbi:MAG: hypothetical protein KGI29_05255 [Pseudomonadota bacterium]|nr:hypothetical protein [Pseudomonadota bacterium]MDE3037023.1 hypothetical protein [Pseudomonadota bacterium]
MSTEQRFEQFVRELTAISKKHGVAVMSIGGVFILDDANAMQDIAYTCDASSGDLEFRLSQ